MHTQVFADASLHAVDLGQEARRGSAIVRGVRLRLSEVGDLLLEPPNAFERGSQFGIVGDHGCSGMIVNDLDESMAYFKMPVRPEIPE